jgi:hypothetical protein
MDKKKEDVEEIINEIDALIDEIQAMLSGEVKVEALAMAEA